MTRLGLRGKGGKKEKEEERERKRRVLLSYSYCLPDTKRGCRRVDVPKAPWRCPFLFNNCKSFFF